jgi:ERCC4-related helicase
MPTSDLNLETLNAIPEQGQLVEVRGRRFAVLDIRRSSLPTPALKPNATPLHLITLSSVEDEDLGETQQVMWELEPGARVFEARRLPTPKTPEDFDTPDRLGAFLDAVRWGAGSAADVANVQSPFRSGIEIEDYQLDPVVRAVQMPRANLLIADDVGLGKTIEAGLVAQELLLRQRVRKILIVCPSSLQIQWQEQMRDKFGLDFRVVNTDLMRQLRRSRGLHVNPWTHYPRLITSIDFLKRDRPLRLMREALPSEGESIYPRRIDLLILDEAHNVAPSGSGKYATDSQRTAAIRLLAPHCEHKLFLSATPHNGYSESFTALLELLDNQRFARGIPPDRKQLQVVTIRRLKQELPPDDFGKPRFPKRSLYPLTVNYSDTERQIHQDLQEYTDLRIKAAGADRVAQTATEFVLKLLKKRLFSSPAAFATTLAKHEQTLRDRSQYRRSVTSPTEKILRRQIDSIEEDYADDELYEAVTADIITETSSLFDQLGDRERELIRRMREWSEKATRRADVKAEGLLSWIEENLRSGGAWNQARVIIFTEYRTTQKWLFELLAARGWAKGDRLMTLYGGMNSDDRETVKAAFQADPEISPVRILLATDAASEGLDLQNHCSNLIHYEIPWNPNRMEQRNGRIDRHGQRASEVAIFHFVGQQYREISEASEGQRPGDLDGDLEFLMRAAIKIDRIREDLGNVGPVIAQQVEEAMLGRRSRLDTQQAERNSEPARRLLKFERDVRKQIEKLKETLRETQSTLRLSPSNIATVVKVGLAVAGKPELQPIAGEPGAFRLPLLDGSWQSCANGLAHPHTGKTRPIVFDADLVRRRDDRVLVHLNHRLVQLCLRLLRAEVWSSGDRDSRGLKRVAVQVVSSEALDRPALVAYGRLVVLGGDRQRLHEEVIAAGGTLTQGRFSRFKSLQELNAALDAVLPDVAATDRTKREFIDVWPNCEEPLLRSLEVRQNERETSLMKLLEQRRDKEIADITAILQELERGIRSELDSKNAPEQLDLFSSAERSQYDRDRDSLRLRLDTIPAEIEREAATIRKRFANPTTRLFPLAVTCLIPRRLNRD